MSSKHPGGATRLRKWIIRCTIAVGLYTLAGFFAVPALIKWQLQKQLPPTTHRVAAVEGSEVQNAVSHRIRAN
jgi:hypothetical protein